MKYFTFVSFIIIVCLGVEIGSCSIHDQCRRQIFYEYQNIIHNGKVLVRDGPWPWTLCRRLCRQYLECFSFSVEWKDHYVGVCIIYSGILNFANMINATDVTTYSK
ncbi:hypothetical protein LSH36_296g02019 [Paralvinella palmiformis]|uniref:Apple domain-containing protein n=1 Tax=Paralvinella palmiformis TaxID=53620 RepID=A0AAD9N3B0_9ANNE|nr:hypothetical protein LSH36_296g02019 [Paralvinella palmiformis]